MNAPVYRSNPYTGQQNQETNRQLSRERDAQRDSLRSVSRHIELHPDLAIGSICVKNNAVQTVIASANTPVLFNEYSVLGNNGPARYMKPHFEDGLIEITKTCLYCVEVPITLESVAGAASKCGMDILVVGQGEMTCGGHAHRSLAGGGGDVGFAAPKGWGKLYAGDRVGLTLTNETNTKNYIGEDVAIYITQIGI